MIFIFSVIPGFLASCRWFSTASLPFFLISRSRVSLVVSFHDGSSLSSSQTLPSVHVRHSTTTDSSSLRIVIVSVAIPTPPLDSYSSYQYTYQFGYLC